MKTLVKRKKYYGVIYRVRTCVSSTPPSGLRSTACEQRLTQITLLAINFFLSSICHHNMVSNFTEMDRIIVLFRKHVREVILTLTMFCCNESTLLWFSYCIFSYLDISQAFGCCWFRPDNTCLIIVVYRCWLCLSPLLTWINVSVLCSIRLWHLFKIQQMTVL